MTSPSSHLVVVIIHYQRVAATLQAIQSVLESTFPGKISVVVVDHTVNPQDDISSHLAPEWTKKITVLTPRANLGFAGGNNYGLRFAQENLHPDTLVLLNDDATVHPLALLALHNRLHGQKKIGAVAAKIFFTKGHEFHPGYLPNELGNILWFAGGCIDWVEVTGFHRGVDEVDRGQYNQATPIPFATGCCVALHPQALQEIGLLDERYFLYLEDLDLSVRLNHRGWEVWYEPAAECWHDNAGSSGSGSVMQMYYQTRNRFLFGFRYAPWRTKLFLAKLMVQYLKHPPHPIYRRAILDVVLHTYGQNHSLHVLH